MIADGWSLPRDTLAALSMRPGRNRFSAFEGYQLTEKELLKGRVAPFHRLLRQEYGLSEEMDKQDIKPKFRKVEGLLVQNLPVWVGTLISSNLFFRALYSWEEFWDTVAAGWAVFGDPRLLSRAQWAKWMSNEVCPSHDGYFAGRGKSIFLWPTEALGDRIEQATALYDHGYRVMDWLGFNESTMPMWWLFAFAGGQMHRIEPWLPWFKTHIAYDLTGGLRPFQGIVSEKAKGWSPLEPERIAAVWPPADYDIKSPRRQGKYTQFDPRLLFPRFRRPWETPNTYMPDPFTARKLTAISKAWGQERDLEREAKKRAKEMREVIQQVLKHPMYRLIQMAKFGASEESQQRLNKIRDLVNECSGGKRAIEELLYWALMEDQSESAKNRLKEFDEALRYSKMHTLKEVLNKVYKQVKAWFDRRGVPMPKVKKDWRDKIIKTRISQITRD